jgi:outer membrane biosynthesis protein TonB
VFTELEVDSAVVRSALSAGPAYPLDLLAKHVEGMALVRYVVDTTGFADTESFTVIQTTDPGFARAVRDALPYMRFSPAKIGPKKVRMLVEQPFTFKISPTLANGAKP